MLKTVMLWLIYTPKNRIDIEEYPSVRDRSRAVPRGAREARNKTELVGASTSPSGV